jgi:acetyl-CoA carboxylase biotin carboxyl carrier protein
MKIDLVKQLIQEFENSGVHKMKIEIEDLKLELEKPGGEVLQTTPVTIASQKIVKEETTVVPVVEEVTGTAIKSPIVGVFYRSSSPTSKAFVEVGDMVKEGQVLCIVEAMKVMNEIKSPINGVVKSISVNNDDLVEFDQILMMIEG